MYLSSFYKIVAWITNITHPKKNMYEVSAVKYVGFYFCLYTQNVFLRESIMIAYFTRFLLINRSWYQADLTVYVYLYNVA